MTRLPHWPFSQCGRLKVHELTAAVDPGRYGPKIWVPRGERLLERARTAMPHADPRRV